jgi:hypothetical protein
VTSSWRGLDTLVSLRGGDSLSEAVRKEYDVPELQQHPFLPLASLCLTNPSDPRYQTIIRYREQLGKILHAGAVSLRAEKTEDHTDAVSSKPNHGTNVLCTDRNPQHLSPLSIPIYSTMESRTTLLGANGLPLILAGEIGSSAGASMTCQEIIGPSLRNVITIIAYNISLAADHTQILTDLWFLRSWSFAGLRT